MLNKELLYATIQKFGVEIDDNAFERLDKYAEMLVETNKSFNLTAITEPDDVTVKHFADCLALFGMVDIPENAKIIDVGTGAGFPGIPLKIVYPGIDFVLVDSLNKRVKFLKDVKEALGLEGLEALHGRAEDLARDKSLRASFDLCVGVFQQSPCRFMAFAMPSSV